MHQRDSTLGKLSQNTITCCCDLS